MQNLNYEETMQLLGAIDCQTDILCALHEHYA